MLKTKELIKSGISQFIGKHPDQINIQTDWISFDIFDTLILRKCGEPKSVFRIMEYSQEGFYEQRIDAEKTARSKSVYEEITLDDIYEQLESVYGRNRAAELKSLEVETELSLIIPNPEMMPVFNDLVRKGKTVFLISDMYLSTEVISKMLDKCGVRGYQELYVSSEYKKTKRSGSLFDFVLEENNLKPEGLLHIGDHPLSDYLIPSKRGIQAFLYKRSSPRNIFLKNIKPKLGIAVTEKMRSDYEILRSVSLNCCQGNSDAYYLGSQVLGPMVYGFSCWLHDWVIENDIKKLFFLSREGHTLMDSYKELFGEDETEIHYINVSRLALCRANIINTHSFAELIELMVSVMRNIYFVNEFISLLGIIDRINEICTRMKCSPNEKLENVDKEIFYKAIISVGYDYFSEQNKNLLQYLLDHEMIDNVTALVDVGWSGTMQMKLSQFVPGSHFIGNYLAINNSKSGKGYSDLDRRAYWGNDDNSDKKNKIFRFSTGAIEELFMSDEGTTLEYSRKGDQVIPVKDSIYLDESTISKIEDVHKGMIDFVSEGKDIILNSEPYVFIWPYIVFAVYPGLVSVQCLEGFYAVDGVHKSKLLPEQNFLYYFFHPWMMKKELEENVNKVLWFKALLKIPFPYFDLLCFMTDKLHMKSDYQKKNFDQKEM